MNKKTVNWAKQKLESLDDDFPKVDQAVSLIRKKEKKFHRKGQ